MATYEYRCLDCDERFEARRPMALADEATCPAGHGRVKRLLSRRRRHGPRRWRGRLLRRCLRLRLSRRSRRARSS